MFVTLSHSPDHLLSFTFRLNNRTVVLLLSIDLTLRSVNIISMKENALRRGRPPSEQAASHAAIMDAVYSLLQKKSVRDLTMEEVAKRAKVGKPTLYKWWPTKATLVLAMLCERMAPKLGR